MNRQQVEKAIGDIIKILKPYRDVSAVQTELLTLEGLQLVARDRSHNNPKDLLAVCNQVGTRIDSLREAGVLSSSDVGRLTNINNLDFKQYRQHFESQITRTEERGQGLGRLLRFGRPSQAAATSAESAPSTSEIYDTGALAQRAQEARSRYDNRFSARIGRGIADLRARLTGAERTSGQTSSEVQSATSGNEEALLNRMEELEQAAVVRNERGQIISYTNLGEGMNEPDGRPKVEALQEMAEQSLAEEQASTDALQTLRSKEEAKSRTKNSSVAEEAKQSTIARPADYEERVFNRMMELETQILDNRPNGVVRGRAQYDESGKFQGFAYGVSGDVRPPLEMLEQLAREEVDAQLSSDAALAQREQEEAEQRIKRRNTKLSRVAMEVTAAGVGTTIALSSPLWAVEGYRAYNSDVVRSIPLAITARQPLEDTTLHNLTSGQRLAIWEKYFQPSATEQDSRLILNGNSLSASPQFGGVAAIPFDVWDMKYPHEEVHFMNMSRRLETLANIYFQAENDFRAEMGQEPLDFAEYYDQFLGTIKEHSDKVGLDFNVALMMFEISGRNITSLVNQGDDVKVSTFQVLLAGVGEFLQDSPYKESIYDKVPYLRNLTDPEKIKYFATYRGDDPELLALQKLSSSLPITRWNVVRLLGTPTVGINDIEPYLIADAMNNYVPDEVEKSYREKYPDVATALDLVLEAKKDYDDHKINIRENAEKLIKQYPALFDNFFSENEDVRHAAFDAIGLGDNLDPAQVQTYSRAWRQMTWLELEEARTGSNLPGNEELNSTGMIEVGLGRLMNDRELMARVAGNTRGEYAFIDAHANRHEAIGAMMRDQVEFPKFIAYLERRAEELQIDPMGVSLIGQLADSMQQLRDLAKPLRSANNLAYTELSKLEYDTEFQPLTGTAFLKMISDMALQVTEKQIGTKVDFDNLDHVRLHTFNMIAIREISPITLMTNEFIEYPRLAEGDPPYHTVATIHGLNMFYQAVKKKGVFPQGGEQSFDNWMHIIGNLNEHLGEGLWDEAEKGHLYSLFREVVLPPMAPAAETADWYMRRMHNPDLVSLNVTPEERAARREEMGSEQNEIAQAQREVSLRQLIAQTGGSNEPGFTNIIVPAALERLAIEGEDSGVVIQRFYRNGGGVLSIPDDSGKRHHYQFTRDQYVRYYKGEQNPSIPWQEREGIGRNVAQRETPLTQAEQILQQRSDSAEQGAGGMFIP